MTIETKYNIGQEVWFMNKNKAYNTLIHGIRVDCDPEDSGFIDLSLNAKTLLETKPLTKQVRYTLSPAYDAFYDESELFPTKEELLKSL